MLAGLANGRTVNLGHLASQFPGTALHVSSYRHLHAFSNMFGWMEMWLPG